MITLLQGEQIKQLRSQGVGYRNIATQLNMTRDQVRNYCKTHNLNGYREAVRMNIRRFLEDDSICTFCGKKLIQPRTGRRRLFCDGVCRRKWWDQNRDKVKKSPEAVYVFTCKCCGKEFTVYGNRSRQYCSRECYVNDRFWGGSRPKDEVMIDFETAVPTVTRIG